LTRSYALIGAEDLAIATLGGLAEFVGRTGTILGKEDKLYRVKLDEPVEIPNVGLIADEHWEGRLLRRLPQIRTDQAAAEQEVQTQPPAKPVGTFRYEGI
jgi:hypothetical protein